jgi:hypothetical protein
MAWVRPRLPHSLLVHMSPAHAVLITQTTPVARPTLPRSALQRDEEFKEQMAAGGNSDGAQIKAD